MANRIIQESICSSDTINGLTPEAEITFYRLLVCVDDYARIDGRPAMLKAKLYPLRTKMSEEDVFGYMDELENAGLIWSYHVGDRMYYQVTTWEEHQRVRNKRSKCPAPLDSNSPRVAVKCQQDAAKCGLNPNPNPNPYPYPNPKPEERDASAQEEPVQITPPPASPTPAAGHLGDEITDEELEKEREMQDTAERYVLAYNLPYNDRTLDAVVSDIRTKGADAVRAALDAATDADTKGGISLAFYRAILNGTGKRRGRDAPPGGDMIRHTREEFDRTSMAAIIDLDEEE